jgi:cell division protein FtsB
VRKLTVVLVVLIALLQYPLWLGKGSWLRVWQYSQQIETHEKRNEYYRQRNDTLRAEVRDLKQGQSAIEERARSELGLVKQDEVFFQVIQNKQPASNKPTSPLDAKPVDSKLPSTDTAATQTAQTKPASPVDVVSPPAAK